VPAASHNALATPRSILVIKPSSLGDVVHTLPAVACVKNHWPQARIRWLVNPEWAPLLQGNPYLEDVIEFPRKRFGGMMGWTKFSGWMRALKERAHPDLVLDFQGLFRSALIGRWSGGEVWGTSDSREGARFLHHHRVEVAPRSAPVHAVTRTLALVRALGCPVPERLEWPLPSGVAPKAALPPRYVLLHPFSRGRGKSLTVKEVSAICEALAPTPVVLAGRCDLHLPALANVTNLLNATTLPELCWLIANAAFTVSVDSGPMHIAAALTDRLLAIHTWSDPRQVGPYQPKAWVWKDDRVGQMEVFPNGEACSRSHLAAWIAARATATE
jgi:heptosyltransferase-1